MPLFPGSTARDVPGTNHHELQRPCHHPGMFTSHGHTCASGVARMTSIALTLHIPLVLIEMKGSGKIVISGENFTSPKYLC